MEVTRSKQPLEATRLSSVKKKFIGISGQSTWMQVTNDKLVDFLKMEKHLTESIDKRLI